MNPIRRQALASVMWDTRHAGMNVLRVNLVWKRPSRMKQSTSAQPASSLAVFIKRSSKRLRREQKYSVSERKAVNPIVQL